MCWGEMAERVFLREVHLSNIRQTLLFYQNSVGNVSCVVWDAALVLTKYLERRAGQREFWLKGKRVVELGAGLGCVGITAACYGAEVVLTDLPDVVPQLEKTIDINRMAWNGRGTLSAAALTWGKDGQVNSEILKQPIDFLLLSDCVYYEESLDPLLSTLKSLCSESTEILLAQEKRESEKQKEIWKTFNARFFEEFSVSKVPPNEQDETYCSPDIYLYRAKRK